MNNKCKTRGKREKEFDSTEFKRMKQAINMITLTLTLTLTYCNCTEPYLLYGNYMETRKKIYERIIFDVEKLESRNKQTSSCCFL